MYNINSDPTIINCSFTLNFADFYGGGIYNSSSAPTLTNCNFTNNQAYHGGGLYNSSSDPTLTNCSFIQNFGFAGLGMLNSYSNPILTNCSFALNITTRDYGGGMVNWGSNPVLINCSFAKNSAPEGGAIYNDSYSDQILKNCIFWDNSSEFYNGSNSSTTVTYSIVEGGWPGTGNLDLEPWFVNSTIGDLRLQDCSPAINAGDNTANNTTNDLAKNVRIFNGIIDMGAYENQKICCPVGSDLEVFVDPTANGMYDGSSWTNAYTNLQDVLDTECSQITKIHVAGGTYYPTQLGDRMISFNMRNNLEILGGYPAGGGPRDVENNPTILSGDIGIENDSTDNSYHVVSNFDLDSTAVLDGFIITGGNADDSFPDDSGGGMLNIISTPTVTQCTFIENNAVEGGGIYNLASDMSLTNCSLSENVADNGAGIYNALSLPSLTNCILWDNTAVNDGGGLYNSSSSPSLTNCSFALNSAVSGSGLYNNAVSMPTVTNCILWDQRGSEIAGSGTPTVSYSIIDGGYAGTGNLDLDPLYTDPSNGNLSLDVCSPAAEAGNNSANSTTLDYAGNPRLFGTTIDIGAYENQEECPGTCTEDNIVIGNVIIPSGITHAISNITAEGYVPSPNVVVFKAGTDISLSPGFEVELGATFQAGIEACSVDLSSEKERSSTKY